MPTLDQNYLVKALLDGVEDGVKQGLKEIRDQAQKHAPVRDIFRHGHGNTGAVQSMAGQLAGAARSGDFSRVWHAAASGSLQTMSVASAQRMGVFTTGTLPSHAGRAIKSLVSYGKFGERAQGRETSQLSVRPGTGVVTSKRITGRANSYAPVIASPAGMIGGQNLRHWAGPNVLEIGAIRNPSGGSFQLASLLSARGRYEAFGREGPNGQRSGRGRAVRSVGGQAMVGGRLHDGITVDGPYRDGAEVYGYVQAVAHDPGRTHNYAADQEFGSRHNKAQPFLRPGLRESKGRILKIVDPTKGRRGLLQRGVQSGPRPPTTAGQAESVDVQIILRVTGTRQVTKDLWALIGVSE